MEQPRRSWTGPTDDELAALDALGKAGEWTLGRAHAAAHQPRQGAVPRQVGRGGAKALTKRDLIRHHAVMAPAMLPYLADRPVNLHRFPDGDRQAGLLAQGGAVATRRSGSPAGATRTTARRDRVVLRRRLARRARLDGQLRRHRAAPVDVHGRRPAPADLGDDRHRPRAEGDLRRRARAGAACTAPRSSTSACEACPKVTGKRGIQIWVPVADGLRLRRTPAAWVERLSRAIGDTVPDLVSWEWEKAKRGGRTRLDYTQNAINKTLVAPFSARPVRGRTGVGADRLGRARRPRADVRSMDHPQTSASDSPEPATRSRRSSGASNGSRRCEPTRAGWTAGTRAECLRPQRC